MKTLINLLKLTQEQLKIVLYEYLKQKKMNPIFEDGYLYVKGDIPIMLVAHMDTVFANPPKDVLYDKNTDIIYNPSGGLGGDDRCGIYIILKLLSDYRPYVLFTEDEEIGLVGAKKAAKKIERPNIKYIIEFDRKGKNDCVFYYCGNKEFMDYIQSFGFEKSYGSKSDISILGPSWDIASVNLSSGYYNAHKKNEYIIFNDLRETLNRSKSMIQSLEKAPYFDHQDIKIKCKKPL